MPLTSPPPERQTNPLLPGYDFNIDLVAGVTPIRQGGLFDFYIDRPNGMRGYIINMTTRGRGLIHEDGNSRTCELGDLLLFPPGVAHYYGRDPASPEWRHHWIYFRPRAYWSQWLDWPQKFGQIGTLTISDPTAQTEICELFKEIEAVHRRATPLASDLSINLLERLLLRCAEENATGSAKQLDARVLRACHLITQHLFEDLTLADLARAVHLSPSRLEHLFRDQIGITISRWREEQRLIHARQLLQLTHSPISVIAASVGYDDQLYFSRVFRKRVGISPTEFRNRTPSEVRRTVPENIELLPGKL